MKVLLINNQHYMMGGAHKMYFNTEEILRSNGHEVAFFSTLDNRNIFTPYSKFFIKSIDYKNLSFFNKIMLSFKYLYNKEVKKKLIKLIDEFKPDIAHIHLFYGALSISVLNCLKKKNIPIVNTVHDYRILCPANTFLDKNSIYGIL